MLGLDVADVNCEPGLEQQYLAVEPIGHSGNPEEIADAVL